MSEDRHPHLPAVISVRSLKKWLTQIFPDGTAHRNYVVRDMAAKTVFVMLYCGAIEGARRWFRPSQATLMTDSQASKTKPAERLAWTKASLTGRVRHSSGSWYAPNSREPIRDETLRSGLIPLGAVVERAGIPTTSSVPRYGLSRSFCDLLLALERGRAGQTEIERWQQANLSAEALARVRLVKRGIAAGSTANRVRINFPNGESRLMLAGPSADITKAVIETFAVRFLSEPAVLFISDSGEKVVARDEELAAQLGLRIQADRNLPDIILLDAASGDQRLVFIEVVASDGAITPQRKEALARLAQEAKFAASSVYFVTAFRDRGSPAFRKLAPELAWDTFAWFASEPAHLLFYRANARLRIDKLSV